MTPRFLALLLVLFLAGGATVLLFRPEAPATHDATTAEVPTASLPVIPRSDSLPAASEAFFILAVSWQPAFCETAPTRPECRSQTADRFDASHFTLHGLWPRDEYCDVEASIEATDRNGRWSALPAIDLPRDLRARLDTAMPGTMSQLDRHEWIKHGSCFPGDAEAYFSAALALLDTLNASPVRELFADNVGRRLTRSQIRGAFDRGFGPGAGERVRLACAEDGERTLIVELTLGLWGRIGSAPDLGDLVQAARPTNGGCNAGLVDATGLQ